MSETTLKKLSEYPQPQNLEDALRTVYEYLDQKPGQIDNIRADLLGSKSGTYAIKVEDYAGRQHHGFGMHMRNELGLWRPESPLVKWCAANLGIAHADDISSVILDGVFCGIIKQERHTDALCAHYKKHWQEQGCDPLTGEGLPEAGREKPDWEKEAEWQIKWNRFLRGAMVVSLITAAVSIGWIVVSAIAAALYAFFHHASP